MRRYRRFTAFKTPVVALCFRRPLSWPHPLLATARNFAASVPLCLVASALTLSALHLSVSGLLLAIASGGLTSALGYVAWYAALPFLTATRASIVQLAVPPLASALGIVFLGETVTVRLMVAAPLILGGIALAVAGPRRWPSMPPRAGRDAR